MIKRKRKLNKLLITDRDLYKVISNGDEAHCFPVGTLVRRVGAALYENIHTVVCMEGFATAKGETIQPGVKQILLFNEVSK